MNIIDILKADAMQMSLSKSGIIIDLVTADGTADKISLEWDELSFAEAVLIRLQFEKRLEFVGTNTANVFKESSV